VTNETENDSKAAAEKPAGVVAKGNRVSIDYTGRLEDGTVFDSSDGKQPIEFVAGSGQVIKGFDDALIGMRKGEGKQVRIEPQDGYGERDEKLQQHVPKSVFPPEMKLEAGMGFSFKTPDGQVIHASITSVSDDSVTLDLNHPLAGKILAFDIKVVDIS